FRLELERRLGGLHGLRLGQRRRRFVFLAGRVQHDDGRDESERGTAPDRSDRTFAHEVLLINRAHSNSGAQTPRNIRPCSWPVPRQPASTAPVYSGPFLTPARPSHRRLPTRETRRRPALEQARTNPIEPRRASPPTRAPPRPTSERVTARVGAPASPMSPSGSGPVRAREPARPTSERVGAPASHVTARVGAPASHVTARVGAPASPM